MSNYYQGLYFTTRDEVERGDISNILAHRAQIETNGLDLIIWTKNDKSDYPDEEDPEVRHFVALLLEAWPEIFWSSSFHQNRFFAFATCENIRRHDDQITGEVSAVLRQALERAGLDYDFSKKGNDE